MDRRIALNVPRCKQVKVGSNGQKTYLAVCWKPAILGGNLCAGCLRAMREASDDMRARRKPQRAL